MILYIKQEGLSEADSFTVKNDSGMDAYYVENEYEKAGIKLHIKDIYHNELAVVKQKLASLVPCFLVEENGSRMASIKKAISVFTPHYNVKGPEWTVSGDLSSHDYTIKKGSRNIAVITRAWFPWGDSYEIDVTDDKNTLLSLAAVLAIDAACSP